MALSVDHKSIGIVQGNDSFLRIKTLINHACYEIYCKLFLDSNYGGFSRQPDIIYREFLQYRSVIESLKDNGDITEGEFLTIFSPSEETYLRECSLSLLHKLTQVCVKTFPNIENDGNVSFSTFSSPKAGQEEKPLDSRPKSARPQTSNGSGYVHLLEKLQSVIDDNNLQKRLQSSVNDFEIKWREIVGALQGLGYDISKIESIKTMDDLDSCKTCHLAYLRSEAELLQSETENLFNMTEVNTITLTRLITNLKEAFTLEGKDKREEEYSILQEMKDVRGSIERTKGKLDDERDSISLLFPDLKFWKDKNIEGDIIIIDDTLTKLSEVTAKQNRLVSHYFNTVSLDIVKIKERISNQLAKNVKYVKTHEADATKDKKINLGVISIGF